MVRPVALVTILVFVTTVTALSDEPKLEYASVVFRHGERSPTNSYGKNDPYPESTWPQGYGQLNIVGAKQHFELGRLLQKRYTVEFPLISANYTRSEVYVRSTDYDRTLMSALSQLSGLFPPIDDAYQLNDTVNWQPIPVHTVPQAEDNLLLPHGKDRCPRFDQLLDENEQTEAYKKVNRENQDFFDFLKDKTGWKGDLNSKNVWRIADPVIVELQWGRDPGGWVNDTVAERLQNLSNIDFQFMFDTSNAREKQRLTSGTLVGAISDRMKKKIARDSSSLIPGTNLVLYSAHDTTVGAFLSALQIFDGVQPPYASAVLVELYSDPPTNDKYHVELWYLNQHTTTGFDLTKDTSSFLIPKKIPGCDTSCLLDTFIKLTADVVPSDWQKECEKKKKSISPGSVVIVSLAVGIPLIVVAMLLIVFFCSRARKHRRYQEIRQVN